MNSMDVRMTSEFVSVGFLPSQSRKLQSNEKPYINWKRFSTNYPEVIQFNCLKERWTVFLNFRILFLLFKIKIFVFSKAKSEANCALGAPNRQKATFCEKLPSG